jgi:glycosyltransferase involved in cell wall biosynthesis
VPDRGGEELSVLLALAHSEGGIGRHVRTLATALREREVSVVLAAPPASIVALGLGTLGVELVPVPLGERSPSALWRSRRALGAAAASVDVVHAHGLRAGAGCAVARLAAPLVVTWHNAPQGAPLGRRSHALLARFVARTSDLTLAASDDLEAEARAGGARDVIGVFVSAPALGPPARTPADVRAELGIGSRPLVVAIGRLHSQKRLDVLVAAAAGWGSAPMDPCVVIAGDGPAQAELSSQIEASAAPVTLLGAREDVADLLGAADVVALPSVWEARALVAQEALRAGVPLVTTAVGGLPSLVGDAALIVPVGDAAALRRAIERVLADPALRDRMVAEGLARAASWPTQAQTVEDLISIYLDLRSRSRP